MAGEVGYSTQAVFISTLSVKKHKLWRCPDVRRHSSVASSGRLSLTLPFAEGDRNSNALPILPDIQYHHLPKQTDFCSH